MGLGILKWVVPGLWLLCALVSQACGGIAEVSGGQGGAGNTSSGGRTGIGGTNGPVGALSAGAPAVVGSAAGAPGTLAPAGSIAEGLKLFAAAGCFSCHGMNAAGAQGPNISSSPSAGIGAWTYQQFHDAVRLAKNRDGSPLCLFMVPFSERDVSEKGIQDLYAFLMSTRPVDVVNKGSYCP